MQRLQVSGALPSAFPESGGSLRARMHAAALTYGFADVIVFEDAHRIFRNLTAHSIIPLMDSFTDVRPRHHPRSALRVFILQM